MSNTEGLSYEEEVKATEEMRRRGRENYRPHGNNEARGKTSDFRLFRYFRVVRSLIPSTQLCDSSVNGIGLIANR
jgi:hypothetical protein